MSKLNCSPTTRTTTTHYRKDYNHTLQEGLQSDVTGRTTITCYRKDCNYTWLEVMMVWNKNSRCSCFHSSLWMLFQEDKSCNSNRYNLELLEWHSSRSMLHSLHHHSCSSQPSYRSLRSSAEELSVEELSVEELFVEELFFGNEGKEGIKSNHSLWILSGQSLVFSPLFPIQATGQTHQFSH